MTSVDTITTHMQKAPELWVDTYGDSLYSYALYRTNDTELAKELVQETFVAALTARHGFKGKSKEKTWFISILKKKIADYIRRKYRDNAQSFDESTERANSNHFDERGNWLEKPSRWHNDPGSKVEQTEFMTALHLCLAGLPEKQSDAFSMREIDDHDQEDICKVLGISPTNYWVLLHRARLAIRSCLEKNWFSDSVTGR